jgi:tetratricopeptide (TPR) repeat protein
VQVEKAWHRWNEVLRSVAFLRLLNRSFLRRKTLSWTYDFEEARALAGLGRLDEALRVVAKHRGQTPGDQARFSALLVGVYECADRFDDALRAAEESVRGRPADPTAWLDLASLQVRRRRDPAAARQALEKAEAGAISEVAAAYRRFVLGLVLTEEGAYGPAAVELGAAVVYFTWRNVAPGLVELCRLYRAFALARLGRVADAQRDLASSRAMMLAAGEGQLVLRVDTALNDALTGSRS